jgi:putative membrane protein
MLEIIIAILAGILTGTITGLIPGLHINTVAVVVITSLAFLLSFLSPLAIIIFITSMAITHTFIDFIPAIFFGAPDEDTALGILPGHDFLIRGEGHEAVILTLIGSSSAIILTLIIAPIFIFAIPYIYPFIQRMMAFFLIWISIFLIYREKHSKLQALLIFFLAGFLGLATLNLPIRQPLLPLLAGLFGASTLIFSISKKTTVPKQKITEIQLDKKQLSKPLLATSLISPIFSFLPGLGSSQAALIGSEIFPMDKKQFLILLGSINTLVMSTSFVTLYLINKTRTGAASAIQQISTLSLLDLIYIFIAIIISATISIFLAIKFSKVFARNIHKINYSKISVGVLILITFLVLYFTGFLGLLIFATATLLGLTSIILEVRRGFLMGSLLIPTIIFYLPF